MAAQSDTTAAEERFDGKADSVIPGPITGDSLVSAVDAALTDVPAEPRNSRAERYAAVVDAVGTDDDHTGSAVEQPRPAT